MAGFQDARRPSRWIRVEMCRTQLHFLSLRHWSIVLRDVVFIHRPGSCTTGFLEEFNGSAIDLAGSEVWEGIEVDNVKPQVDRFVFPDVHRVTVLASS